MFIKSIKIAGDNGIIRDIHFESGLNLIIDKTPTSDHHKTGNNVGKTTVLKLVDFCLGANSKIIYTDTENKKETYNLVEDFLISNNVKITLILVDNLYTANSEVIIERNFIKGKNAIRNINGKPVLSKDFETELQKVIMPGLQCEKPTFRQLISHNIRYRDETINNTLKTLNKFTSDVEYETLYLFLLGCTFYDGAKKQALLAKLSQEESFRERLEKKQTKSAYEIAIGILDDEIYFLNKKKANLNLNKNFESDLEELNSIKYHINKTSSSISKMKIRKNLIEEAQEDIEQNISSIDLVQLKTLYSEAKMNIANLQKTFEDLVKYHNNMLIEKAKFIGADLPTLIARINREEDYLFSLLKQEKDLSVRISKSDSFEYLEQIIEELNEKYRIKGEYESIVSQLEDVEKDIEDLKKSINDIDNYLFSKDYEEVLKKQRDKFNRHFSAISQELYGEKYALKFEKTINKKKQQIYKFTAFNTNMSSGKKQGEILCFDLAYILFADEENIPCLHFLLNDKKELLHDNQLIEVADYVKDKNIQLIISILKDKLPTTVIDKAHTAIELSQESKLFKIEQQK